ncbi:MAG: efflux RND transporter periplasmic adaptor subunit, partial [Bacteroidetes bacterium]|nr:efflux RND transporter periplasmic adaptor subunit [Bacteroidota bacterium]
MEESKKGKSAGSRKKRSMIRKKKQITGSGEALTPEERSLASAKKRLNLKKRRKITSWIIFLVIIAAGAGTYFLFFNEETAISTWNNATNTPIDGGGDTEYTIQQLAFADFVDVSGSVEPAESRNQAFNTTGTLDKIYVGEGDRVTEGDLLAELDSLSALYDVENLRFQIEQAEDISSLEYDLASNDQQIAQTQNNLNELYDLASIALQIEQREDTSAFDYDLANINQQIARTEDASALDY